MQDSGKKGFKFQILLNVLKRRKWRVFFRIGYLLIRNKLGVSNYYMVFEKKLTDPGEQGNKHALRSDFRMTSFACLENIDKTSRERLKDFQGEYPFDLDKCFKEGQVLWTGISTGELVSIIWTKPAIQMKQFYFPLSEDCVCISLCITHPGFRGRGFFSNGLECVTVELAKMGFRKCYISCYEWNIPSRKGIEGSGFRYIGKGRYNPKTKGPEWNPADCYGMQMHQTEEK